MTRKCWLCNISMSCRCCRCCRCCVCCCVCWSCICCCRFCTCCVLPLAPLPPPLGCCAGKCFSRMLVMSVGNISARSEQCHDKYDITISAYSSFSILVTPLLPLNGCLYILTVGRVPTYNNIIAQSQSQARAHVCHYSLNGSFD